MGRRGGGAEAWLLEVLRRIDRTRFQSDCLIHTDAREEYHAELESLGCNLLRCVRPVYLWKYPRRFKRLLQEQGPYDIVHGHVLYQGLVLRLARQAGIPVRLAHSHSDREGFAVDGALLQGSFVRYTNRWVQRDATLGLACGRRAARALFGNGWENDPRWHILHYGLDVSPFGPAVDAAALRSELGLPPDALVVGHVGRFEAQKNHEFLVDIAAALTAREPRAHFLLIGDGPLRPQVEQKVRVLALEKRFTFTGVRSDVPRLMRGAMDVFVLPSRYEGLPLVGIEIQAAGVPAVMTDVITEELDVVPGLIRRVSLTSPAVRWAEGIAEAIAGRPELAQPDALDLVARSRFNIDNCVARLESLYAGAAAAVRG
jgi:glycosyltransferase involved in cell wall biosynthesis